MHVAQKDERAGASLLDHAPSSIRQRLYTFDLALSHSYTFINRRSILFSLGITGINRMLSMDGFFTDGGSKGVSRAYLLLVGLLIWLGYCLLVVSYRVSPLHPLYNFPGPLLPRATYLYEMYFELVKGGKYTHEIKRLHEVYGPMVRINPGGLHCSDPLFVDEVYAGGSRKRNKAPLHVNQLMGPYEPTPRPPFVKPGCLLTATLGYGCRSSEPRTTTSTAAGVRP